MDNRGSDCTTLVIVASSGRDSRIRRWFSLDGLTAYLRVPQALVLAFLGLGVGYSIPSVSDAPTEPNSEYVDALWISQSDRLSKYAVSDGTTLIEIATGYRAIAVDPLRGRLWVLGHGTLEGLSFGGERIVAAQLGGDNSEHLALGVETRGGSIWAGVHKTLYHVDAEGTIVSESKLSHQAVAVAVDEARNQVWAATQKTVTVFDAEGSALFQLDLDRSAKVQALALAPESGEVWVGFQADDNDAGLQKYSANGARLLGVSLASIEHVVVDGQSGVWAATKKKLYRLDGSSGAILFSMQLFAGQGVIDALARHPRDTSVWVAGNQRVLRIDSQSLLVQQIQASNKLRDLAVYVDVIPPTLEFTNPTNQSLLNNAQPALELAIQDDAIGVDTQTLTLNLYGNELEISCSFGEASAECTPDALLPEGLNIITAILSDFAGNESESAELELTIDTIPPEITLSDPADQGFLNQPEIDLVGRLSESADLTINSQSAEVDLNFRFSETVKLNEGANVFELVATDKAGNMGTLIHTINLDTVPPLLPKADLITVEDAGNGQVLIQGEAGSVEPNSTVAVTNEQTGATVTTQADGEGSFQATIDGNASDTFTVVSQDVASNESEPVQVGSSVRIPPDPEKVASPLNENGTTPFIEQISFLFEGPNPIQSNVQAGSIEPRRAAVLRGVVRDRTGAPVPGVEITINNAPELGNTFTRNDGQFDMVVNGGGPITVDYRKDDFLPVQRTIDTQWNDWYIADDVIMVPLDEQVSRIDLSDDRMPFQVARGSVVQDSDGTRQATLLFPNDATAEITLPDGSKEPLTQLDVRATEYTVGESGPNAMPAQLPANSAYTYAVELSVDQALERGIKVAGKDVTFNRPIPFYLDNFLDFPTGEPVPVGFYNNNDANWVPHRDGRIIEILRDENGQVVLDVTGDGSDATLEELTKLGITVAEQQQLSELYEPGDTLWRVELQHLSTWDCNWPYGPPDDAEGPDVPEPDTGDNDQPDDSDEEDCAEGCVIGPQKQSLGESLRIAGTDYTLHYQSDRAEGYGVGNIVDIPLTDSSILSTIESVELEIAIAGRKIRESFEPVPDLSHTFEWDGKDVFGRSLSGAHDATIRIGYTYPCVYYGSVGGGTAEGGGNGFARFGDTARALGTRSRCQGFTFPRSSTVTLKAPAGQPASVGNWNLSVDHFWDSTTNVVYRGNGSQRNLTENVGLIKTVAGRAPGTGLFFGDGFPATDSTLGPPWDVTVGADGSLYIAVGDDNRLSNHVIRQVTPEGNFQTPVGGRRGFRGDGGFATDARLELPSGVAVGSDGSLYIADKSNNRIRQVTPDGIIDTVAGNGELGFRGDGGLATDAEVYLPSGVGVDSEGVVYLTDKWNNRVRRVGPDGIIATVAGNGPNVHLGCPGVGGDGGPATEAGLARPEGVTVGPEGSLYIVDTENSRIRRVTPDGIIQTVAGSGRSRRIGWGGCYAGGRGFSGDGGPATDAELDFPGGVALDAYGSLYIADTYNHRVRKVGLDGTIQTVAGSGATGPFGGGFSGDGGPATDAQLRFPSSVAVGPDGSLYIADRGNERIRRVRGRVPGVGANEEIVLSAADGTQQFVFSLKGAHVRTEDSYTGEVLYALARDSSNRLTAVTDGDGNTTTIERDTQGRATAIVAPHGQRTVLGVNSNGHLTSVTDPTGAAWSMSYTEDGLLTRIEKPGNAINRFAYDNDGKLIEDIDPEGGGWQLARTELADGFSVAMTSREGRTTDYATEHPAAGTRVYTETRPDGTAIRRTHTDGGINKVERADGTVIKTREKPDPRFKFDAPFVGERTIELPSGLRFTKQLARNFTATPEHSIEPEDLDALSETIAVNGREFTRYYDADTRQWTITSPEGRQIARETDSLGRTIALEIEGLAPISVDYDPRSRPSAMTMTDGTDTRTTGFTYHDSGDQAGYLATITDPLGRVTSFASDAAGRVTEETSPGDLTTGFQFDGRSNLESLTPPEREAHLFEYDGLDQQTTYTPPDLSGVPTITNRSYNLDRQLTQIERPDGEFVTFAYDAGGRIASRALPESIATVSYTPTTRQLAGIETSEGIGLAFDWDGFLPTRTQWTGPVVGTVDRTFDSNFWLTQEVVSGRSVGFGYDEDGLLTRAGGVTISRDPNHGLVTGTTHQTVVGTRTHTAFGELDTRQVATDGAGLYEVDYTYDELGRIVQELEIIDGERHSYNYEYDRAGRLSRVTRDGVVAHEYTYDGNGNRLSHTSAEGTGSATYDAQDRIASYGETTYTHTPAGDRLSKTTAAGTTTYDYDAVGNLRQVELPYGTSIEYLIDGRDRRVGKKVDGTLQHGWLYRDALNPVAEINASGQVTKRFIYGEKANVPVYMVAVDLTTGTETTYRIVSDHLGSVRLVVNVETGFVVQRVDYTPFGRVKVDTNPGFQPFGFAGGLYDPDTGLVRFGARDYDPEIGRWTTKDPIGFAGKDANLYGYVLSDPVNVTDINGLFFGSILGRGLGPLLGKTPAEAALAGKLGDIGSGALARQAPDCVGGFDIRTPRDLIRGFGGSQAIGLSAATTYGLYGGAATIGSASAAAAMPLSLTGYGGWEVGSAFNSMYENFRGNSLGGDLYDLINEGKLFAYSNEPECGCQN